MSVHYAVDINRSTLSTTLNTILFAPGCSKSKGKIGIIINTIVSGLFEICKNTENGVKLIKMDNSLHM